VSVGPVSPATLNIGLTLVHSTNSLATAYTRSRPVRTSSFQILPSPYWPGISCTLLLCRRKVHPPPPGFLAARVVTPGVLYNHWDHRPVVIFLQQLFMGYAISVRLPVSTFMESVRWSLRSAPPSPASCCYTSVSCSFRKRLLAHITRNHSY